MKLKFPPSYCASALFLSAAVFILILSPLRADVIYSNAFNTATSDWTANFAESGRVTGTQFIWGNASGVGGTGSVQISGGPENAYYTTALDGFSSSLTEYRISAYFHGIAGASSTANSGFALGLIAGASDVMGLNSDANTFLAMQVNIQATASPGPPQIQLSSRSRTSSGSFAQSSGTAFSSASVYYQLDATFTFDPLTSTFVITGNLWDYGADGTSTSPTLLSTWSNPTAITNADFASDSQIYVALTGAAVNGGANRLDNFTITAVPEPSSVACLFLGILAPFRLRRNRRLFAMR